MSAPANDLDFSALRHTTIHARTPVVQTLQAAVDPTVLEVVSLPTRTRSELIVAVDRLHEATSQAGRTLANQYDFPYPSELETVVLEHWSAFKNR